MKKLSTFLLSLCLIFTACGEKTPQTSPTPSTTPEITIIPETTAVPEKVMYIDHLSTTFYDEGTDVNYDISVIAFWNDGYTARYFCHAENDGKAYRLGAKTIDGKIDSYFFLPWEEGRRFTTDDHYDRLNGDVLTIRDRKYGFYCNVDFTRQTVNYEDVPYDPREDYYKIASKNGYTLYQGNYTGGGDVSYHDIILYEDSTGKHKTIDNIGGMYGGNCGAGFFQNGDVYIIDLDGFTIYPADINQKGHKFRLGDKFTFGDDINKDITARYLLAARRDPVDFTYIAVFMEMPPYEDYYEKFLDGTDRSGRLNCTYKVGYFDSEGNIKKIIDTGEYVQWSYFGIEPVTMYKTGDDTIEFYSRFKSVYINDIISVNLSTHRVSVTDVITASPSGNYLLYFGDRHGYDQRQVMLRNRKTGKDTYLRSVTEHSSMINSYGFKEDDSVYIKQNYSYIVYNQTGKKIFQLGGTGFDLGTGMTGDVYERTLVAVENNYFHYPKWALFYELPTKERAKFINDYQIDQFLKVAQFDDKGNLIKVYDTNLNAFYKGRVILSSVSSNYMSISYEHGYDTITWGKIDIATGVYTAEHTMENTI